jgi:ribonuclease HII
VIAKVTRDRIMADMDHDFPGYDFATHKGYTTPEHRAALAEHGPCREHRRRFVTVRRAERPPGDLGPGDAWADEDWADEDWAGDGWATDGWATDGWAETDPRDTAGAETRR